jgi:anti-sigma factor RsiW
MTALGAHATADLLSAYLDDELSAGDGARIEEHLGACPSCRPQLDSLRRVVDSLRRLDRIAPPPALAQHVVRRVALEGARPGLLARFEDEVDRMRPRIAILTPFAVVFALATILYFFAHTLAEVQNRAPTIVIPPPEAARAFIEPGAGEAAGALIEAVRTAGGRSFRRVGDGWLETDLPADAAPREIAAGSAEAAGLRAAHPWLEELLADAPGVVLVHEGEPVRVEGAPSGTPTGPERGPEEGEAGT